jgi:hypothetical protein
MDPFLEDRHLWPSVRHRLLSAISDMLTMQVTPHFYVTIEERVYSTDERDTDVYIVQPAIPRVFSATEAITITPPTIIQRLPALEVRDRYLSIYDRKNRELVTTLECSPPATRPGARVDAESLSANATLCSQHAPTGRNWPI